MRPVFGLPYAHAHASLDAEMSVSVVSTQSRIGGYEDAQDLYI
jgi:hypothetical protein